MPGAAQNTFDGGKQADLIALLDSPVDAEAAGALHRLRVLKKKNGDVPFYGLIETDEYKAATWAKYGGCASPCDVGGTCHHGPECLRGWFERKHGGGNSAALIEAQSVIEKLRQDNAQLEKDGAALALALKRQEEITGELRGQLARRDTMTQAVGHALKVGDGFLDGLFALVIVWSGAALLFGCAWHVVKAVFGG
jgi:hypothetical protein